MKTLSAPCQHGMQLICSRDIPFVDTETLASRIGREVLFRKHDFFMLYLSDGESAPRTRERLVNLSARQALLWLNEDSEEQGSFWA
jgi:hypothetical protein